MENLKKILNAKSHVFSNFQFSQRMARNNLVEHKLYSKFVILLKFHVEELNGEVYFDLP